VIIEDFAMQESILYNKPTGLMLCILPMYDLEETKNPPDLFKC
jgi:hypothetical protein